MRASSIKIISTEKVSWQMMMAPNMKATLKMAWWMARVSKHLQTETFTPVNSRITYNMVWASISAKKRVRQQKLNIEKAKSGLGQRIQTRKSRRIQFYTSRRTIKLNGRGGQDDQITLITFNSNQKPINWTNTKHPLTFKLILFISDEIDK